jgi:hypothetical protein
MKNLSIKPLSTKLSIFATAILFLSLTSVSAFSQKNESTFYHLKIYHVKGSQEQRVDNYLQNALLPALHKGGIKQVGVFKLNEPDSSGQKVYVLIPYKSLQQFQKSDQTLLQDKQYSSAAKDYLEAVYKNAPYNRIESILLKAFPGTSGVTAPKLTGPKSQRVYELRSYEGPTEAIFQNKVQMFTKGDEVGLFNRLGFNAVFYSEVLVGSRMPNLMYLTTFENKADRDAHWKAFGEDAQWKKLSALPEYKNNVSKMDITFLHPTEYSDL